jgi:biotin carboxyl carrier protein
MALLVTFAFAAGACSSAAPAEVVASSAPNAEQPAAVPAATATLTPPTPTPRPRVVTEQAFVPFATVGEITLHHPATRIERVGFHQSNHEGARAMDVLKTAIAPRAMKSRERLTNGLTAADIVVDPAAEIRAPVTGTVKRAGGYVLYCKYRDDYAVIAPDAHPDWEVKLLHIDGVTVRAGDRVVAGQTLIAPKATKLAFKSQVDKITAKPAWPHVHVEVVDPSIPNVASPGSGC